jgi:DNA-directed RNA polymerase specialized sigma24 family protein
VHTREPPVRMERQLAKPPLRGIDALIARYTSEGLSQREIARRLNIGKGTVQRRQCAQREAVWASP